MIKRVTAFLVTIVLVLMCAAAVSAEELPYVRTVFNERSGLPTGEANDVLQTADGYVPNLDIHKASRLVGSRTRAIMPVHLYGRVCFNEELADIATRHNLLVIEDNAQAIGATSCIAGLYGTHATGGLGHAAGLSFYPTKNVGALGDAGIVTTHDPELAATVRALANYGADRRYHNLYGREIWLQMQVKILER